MDKFLRIIAWVVVWVIFSIIFVALFNFSEVITGSFPMGMGYSIFFWIVVFILLYLPKKSKHSYRNDS